MQNDNNYKFRSLFDIFNEELTMYQVINGNNSKKLNIKEILADDKTSADFINNICYNGSPIFNITTDLKVAHGRARHSVISFLLGLSLWEFDRLFSNIKTIVKDESNITFRVNNKLWLITAVNHDYGYHSEYIKQLHNIDDLGIKYNLLDDSILQISPKRNYNNEAMVCKNSYQNIRDYYIYAQKYHLKEKSKGKEEEEINDHGIVGGLLVYDRVARIMVNKNKDYYSNTKYLINKEDYTELDYYKVACLTICQHNIHKSNNKNTDKDYTGSLKYLHSTGNYFINKNTPLLALLSLVDTIECVKLFSKQENETAYFQTLTILKLVKMYVDNSEIRLDFTELYKKIVTENNEKKKSLLNVIDSHIKSIKSLNDWTLYEVKDYETYKLVIKPRGY